MLLWKEKRSTKEALLIDGARRVGKSWVVEEFAKKNMVPKEVISNRHNIHSIEVKSSSRYSLTSLNKFVAKYGNALAEPIVLHTSDLKEDDGKLFYRCI